jgi:hypothetical protein
MRAALGKVAIKIRGAVAKKQMKKIAVSPVLASIPRIMLGGIRIVPKQ